MGDPMEGRPITCLQSESQDILHHMKKKLYFDFQFTGSQRACLFPCTWHATTVSVPPDKTVIERHRELLDPLPALTGGAPAAIQERREVSAWFYLVTAITSSLDQFCMKLLKIRTI